MLSGKEGFLAGDDGLRCIGGNTMSPFGFGLDWRKSPAHLLLLSNFLRPRVPDDFVQSECWKAVLKEAPRKAIKRYQRQGLLAEPSLHECLDYKYRPAELRSQLEQRRLGTEGAKPELIDRLVAADTTGMRACLRGLRLLRCSEGGQALAEQFLAEKKERRAGVDSEVLTALLHGRFREATQRVAAFEAQQALPRTVDGPWQRYDTATDFAVLKAISHAKPGILGNLGESQLQCLRLAAAMMHLCGTEECRSWLPDGFQVPSRIDSEAAARMVLFSAYHHCNMASLLAAGIEMVAIRRRHNPCPACEAIAQQTYRLSEVPELPYEGCSHERGCRCTVSEA
jgi:hypothetical protein